MDIQRDVDDLTDSVHNYLVESFGTSHLNDLLAKVIAELVGHNRRKNWKHLIDQGFVKLAFIFAVKIILLNFGLEISAARLIEAVELETHQNLLVLSGEHILLEGLCKGVLLTKCK